VNSVYNNFPRPENATATQRVEFLFALYEKLTAPLLPVTKSKKGRRRGWRHRRGIVAD
jgi:hypothetical protein